MSRMTADPEGAQRFQVGDLDVDLQWQTVRRNGNEIELPELSFRLLAALIRAAPERISKDELIEKVWDGVVVSDETLVQRVKLLRQALGDDSQEPRYIASVRGRGYRLASPVADFEHAPSADRINRLWAAMAGVTALMLLGTWLLMSEGPSSLSGDDRETIAVLPFADLSATGEYQHFADGMQEELLARLTAIEGLSVVSRTSVERFRESEEDIATIADAIGADAIIEGSVRIAADRVRITVQMIDAETDLHLWADNFDRELSVANLLMIQQEVAEQIADTLQHDQLAVDEPILPTDSLAAYDAYLLGRYHLFRQTPDNLELAITQLEKATAIDSDFAEAYAALGGAWSFLGTTYGNRSPEEVYPRARRAAMHALSLRPDLAEARSLVADILTWYDWDFDAAEREYLATQERDSLNVLGYALYLSTQQRHDEAVSLVERRVDANPADLFAQVNAAWRYLNARRFEDAIAAARAGAGHPDANAVLGHSLLANGDLSAAVEVFETDVTETGRHPASLSNLAYAYLKSGRKKEAGEILEELTILAETTYVSPALFASIYFAAGDPDTGFELLQTAVSERARDVIFLQVTRSLDGFRDDPRYAALIDRVGF